MKSVFVTLFAITSIAVSAQNVGINTNTPEATLQVVGSPASTTTPDGIIIPSLTGDQLKAKDAAYTAAKTGAMVYITAAASSVTTKTTNVTAAGFYYFDGTVWQRTGRSTQAGQILNTVFIDDPAMVLPANFQSATFTDLITYSYTPVHNNSKIMVQYHNSSYTISGGMGPTVDEFQSQVVINGTVRTVNTQQPSQVNSVNSTFRTGTILPIAGVADNSGTAAITISVQIKRSAGDDGINFSGTNGTLIIQEIAR